MKLSKLVEIWEILHRRDTGDIGFCDLVNAVEECNAVENDLVRY